MEIDSEASTSRPRRAKGNPALSLGIEAVEAVKVYYKSMRKLTRALPALVTACCVLGFPFALLRGQAQQNRSPHVAANETHEGLAISAEPWLDATQYKEPFPKHSPFSGGVVAVHVAFRNDSAEAMKVTLSRVRLNIRVDSDTLQQLQPLSADQVADAAMRPKGKDPTAHRRFPIPVGSGVKADHDKNWTAVQTQAQNAAIPTSVVAPHSTVQGLLYFDIQGQVDLMFSAHLYLPEIVIMGKDQSLTYFEIDLSRSGA